MTTYTYTREVQERIDELVSDIESSISDELVDEHNLEVNCEDVDFLKQIKDLPDSENNTVDVPDVEELMALLEFKEEVTNYTTEWDSGETLIEQGTEAEYFEEFCKDIGDLPSTIPNYLVINWEETARNLLVDYSQADLFGTTYYFRSN